MYDLGERTLQYAKDVSIYCKNLKKSKVTIEYTKQMIRSAGSVGANYIEAKEALSEKDFIYRIKICKKEAKETCYWLKLANYYQNDVYLYTEGEKLICEAMELVKIFSAIIRNKIK